MKQFFKIIVRGVVLLLIVLYLAFAGRGIGQRTDNSIVCRELKVEIVDSGRVGFITESMVREWLKGKSILGEPISEINTLEIKDELRSHLYVSNVAVYKTIVGELCVEVTQRRPEIRFMTSSGRSCYLTDDGWLVPTQLQYSMDVPIVTGNLELPSYGQIHTQSENEIVKKNMPKNYEFLNKLINFVRFIENDSDLKSMFVQINVVDNSEVELVPRVGNHIVLLGSLDGFEKKLDKLNKFYAEGLGYDGWSKYKIINLKYENQVVCSK